MNIKTFFNYLKSAPEYIIKAEKLTGIQNP